MATFKQYIKKDGSKLWMFTSYLRTDYVTGKQINVTRRGFKTKKEAQQELNRLLSNPQSDSIIKEKSTTFSEMYDMWFEVYKTTVKETTYLQTDKRIKKYVLPTFGSMKLDRIDLKFAQDAINRWAKKFKMYTSLLQYVTKVCDYAVSLEVIESNPFQKVTKPKKLVTTKEKKIKFYSKEELAHFLATANKKNMETPENLLTNKYYTEFDVAVFRLLAFSGMRIGEVLALSWHDINFTEMNVTVDKNLSKTEKGFEVSTTKTTSSNRIISLDAQTLKILKKWKFRQKELLFKNGITKIDFIFTTNKGDMIFRTDLYQRSKRLAEKAELPNIGCHGFRHTHATILFEAGVTAKEVQNRLGHSDITMTLDIYTHVSEEVEKRTTEAFSSYVNF